MVLRIPRSKGKTQFSELLAPRKRWRPSGRIKKVERVLLVVRWFTQINLVA